MISKKIYWKQLSSKQELWQKQKKQTILLMHNIKNILFQVLAPTNLKNESDTIHYLVYFQKNTQFLKEKEIKKTRSWNLLAQWLIRSKPNHQLAAQL